MICSNSLSGQSFTDKLPPEGIIVDAQLVKTESQISRTGNTIYTVNYLNVNRIFSGDTPFDGDIPVLTRGGSTKEGVLVVSHALQFHYDYNYLLALELCTDCIPTGNAYLVKNIVPDFNQKDYLRAYRNWETKPNLVKSSRDCAEGDNNLYLKFGNLFLTPGLDSIAGYIDLKARTDGTSNELYALNAKIEYDTLFFGVNAANNESLDAETIEPAVAESYDITSQDITLELAEVDVQRTQAAVNSILITSDYQSILRLHFNVPAVAINSLPGQLEKLLELTDIQGEYICKGRIRAFDRIEIEDSMIGIAIEGVNDNLEYTIGDIEYDTTVPANPEYAFTVFAASSTNDNRLLQTRLIFSHSATAFFTNQFLDGLLTIDNTPGTMYSDYIDAFELTGSQLTNNSFELIIAPETPFPPVAAFPSITTNPIPFIRLKLRMDDCEEAPELTFLNAGMQEQSAYYDTDLMATGVYDIVTTSPPVNILACGCSGEITITDISPDEIITGDEQVLTITGTNFGTFIHGDNPGDNGTGSSVLFRNGDRLEQGSPSPLYIAAGSNDFSINGANNQWSDTEIKVKVPSTDWLAGPNGVAATGQIKVRNGCNLTRKSEEELFIPYSLSNFRLANESNTYRLGLRSGEEPDADGYTFTFSTEVAGTITNNINLRQGFETALENWCANTNVKFKIKNEAVPNLNMEEDDKINSITFGNVDTSNGIASLSLSQAYFPIRCQNQTIRGLIMSDLDIVISESLATNSNQDRIVTLFTHELGHAHQINHALSDNFDDRPLMHPTGNIEGITINDATGGNRIFSTSQNIIQAGCIIIDDGTPVIVNPAPIGTGNCGGVNSTHNHNIEEKVVFPNPTSGIIKIVNITNVSNYYLTDIRGQIIDEGSIEIGSVEIDLLSFPKGFYTLHLHAGNTSETFKIVKL